MSIIYRPIDSPKDWKPLLADPMHWRKGYSAMALAHCWQEANGFPSSIQIVFEESGIDIFTDIEPIFAIPEYKVALPGGARPSQNDIFVLAKGENHLISITVEGKVSEDFDKPVSEWMVNASSGKKKRLKYLCSRLGLSEDEVLNIRYQLLHRTASAMIEAERFNAQNALMLVHSFSPTNQWFSDYVDFASLYGIKAKLNSIHPAKKISGINLYLGWVKGDEKYLSKEPTEEMIGIVTTKKCDRCGHHEVGITTESGQYFPLKPGMKVEIYE